MRQDEFDKLVEQTFEDCRDLLVGKGGEYAGSEDRLSNFKRGAALTGSTPLQVAMIYLSKHYDSLSTFVRKDAAGQAQRLTEPIEGRLDDIINYCVLIKGLVRERKVDVGERRIV